MGPEEHRTFTQATEAATEADDQGTVRPLPQRFGPYQVLGELGQGGMGAVYLAARADEEYRKRVAIKVIKTGAAGEETVRRFRRERQVLASLDHPNIARLLEGGTAEDGSPYIVMEHIEGRPILEYCDAGKLSIVERLRLFQAVCSAVAYAHTNLVVHRDIKPGNILVTLDGVPRLLDFGIAKLLSPEQDGETATATRLVLTPAYASPEQIRGEAITTATDVYSLGVLLYELLTGQRPYRLKGPQTLDILRAVCEEEPEKPSAAVGRSGAEGLRRRLRGDLDTILLSALQKEPRRRYPSVEALSEDIRRHLERLPIAARKATAAYRAGKFVRRHAFGVTAASAVALLVIGFAVSLAVQSGRLARERDKAQRVSSFLVDLFKVSDPGEARGNTITARELLDQGAERIRGELLEEPEVRAALLDTMGNVYSSLGLYDKALGLLEEALGIRRRVLGSERLEVAESLESLAAVKRERGDAAGAEALHRDALATRRRLLGGEHAEVARSLNGLAMILIDKGDYREAEALHREALAMRRRLLGSEHPEIARSLNNLAIALLEQGDEAGAEALFRESLAMRRKLLGHDHPDVTHSLDNLANVLVNNGDYTRAEALRREALAMRRKLLGDEHPHVALSLDNLAGLAFARGDLAGAEGLYRQAVAMRRKLLGDEHPHVAHSLNNLAEVLDRQGRSAEAEALYREALATSRKLLGAEHPQVAWSLTGLGSVLTRRGAPLQAEPLLRTALAIRSKRLPEGHPEIAETEGALGSCLTALQRYAEAEPFLLSSLATLRSSRGQDSAAAREGLERLVRLYEAWGRPEDAARHSRGLSPSQRP